jgi:hypothetical protein
MQDEMCAAHAGDLEGTADGEGMASEEGEKIEEGEGEEVGEVMKDDYKSLDDVRASAVVSDGSSGQDEVVVVAEVVVVMMCCKAVAVDVAVQVVGQGEAHTAVGEEEHQALNLVEENRTPGVEWAVEVVAVAGYLGSDLNARKIRDGSCLLCSVQNTVCKSSRD